MKNKTITECRPHRGQHDRKSPVKSQSQYRPSASGETDDGGGLPGNVYAKQAPPQGVPPIVEVWDIIGAATNGKEVYQPEEETLKRLLGVLEGIPVFFKGNLDPRLALSCGGWREEFPAYVSNVETKEVQ